jgi:hypothetical protein
MRTIVAASIAMALLAVLASPAAAQVPTQDSVTGSGTALSPIGPFTFDIDAHSGPSGENPTGQVTFRFVTGELFFAGPVTCLFVDDNVARMHVDAGPPFGIVILEVTDSPSGDLMSGFPTGDGGGDCSQFGGFRTDFPLLSGDLVVVDAPPLPTSSDQCKNGGWRNFPGFKNEGDCVSFVATGGRNQPSGP